MALTRKGARFIKTPPRFYRDKSGRWRDLENKSRFVKREQAQKLSKKFPEVIKPPRPKNQNRAMGRIQRLLNKYTTRSWTRKTNKLPKFWRDRVDFRNAPPNKRNRNVKGANYIDLAKALEAVRDDRQIRKDMSRQIFVRIVVELYDPEDKQFQDTMVLSYEGGKGAWLNAITEAAANAHDYEHYKDTRISAMEIYLR